MPKKIEITINGKAYPCRQTMGAMLRFKRETGKEVTETTEGSLSDIVTLLWCCIVSASKADGIDFDMDLMTFADAIDVDTAMAWAASIQEGQETAESDEKKSH